MMNTDTTATNPAGDIMFRIMVDGETVESVMYDDVYDVKQYIKMNYFNAGECYGKVTFERIGE